MCEEEMHELDEDVACGRGDEGTVGCHLRDTRGEEVSITATVLSDPGGEELGKTGGDAGGEHLGSERVLFEFFEVGLVILISLIC